MTSHERWVDVGRSRVLVRESGEGRPVLLLQGIGCHTAMWAPVERAWPNMRLISFDPPGVGRSPTRLPPLSIEGLARTVEQLLDELDIDRVDVVGYSLGGTIAQTLTRLAPARVNRLVLVATAPGWGCVPGKWESMIHLYNPLRYFSETYYLRTIGMMAGGQARNDPEFVARHAAERLKDRPGLVGYYSQLGAALGWSSLAWLHEIEAPTLVVAGGDDPLLPPVNSYMLARRIPNARLRIHPNDGHLLLFDDGSRALPDIAEFLAAATLGESATWKTSQHVSNADEREAIRTTRCGMFPWGLASAAYRGLKRPDRASLPGT